MSTCKAKLGMQVNADSEIEKIVVVVVCVFFSLVLLFKWKKKRRKIVSLTISQMYGYSKIMQIHMNASNGKSEENTSIYHRLTIQDVKVF